MNISKLSFDALPFEQQIVLVWDEGHFIARRYEEEDVFGLYRMAAGFFVELYYDQYANEIVKSTSTFANDDTERLSDYSHYIRLDNLRIP